MILTLRILDPRHIVVSKKRRRSSTEELDREMEPNDFRKQARARHALHPTLLKTTLLNQAFNSAQEDAPQEDTKPQTVEKHISPVDSSMVEHKMSGLPLLGSFDFAMPLALSISALLSQSSEIPSTTSSELLSANLEALQILSLCQHTPVSLLALWYFYGPHLCAIALPYFGGSLPDLQTLLPPVALIENDSKIGRDSPLPINLKDAMPIESSNADLTVVYS